MLTIKTPKGKEVSLAKYVSLISAHVTLGSPATCAKGHAACAGWKGGPCVKALLAKEAK